jgi:glycosyltransferase involved in cell wall biosynthesis/SAM-dependent methyltransferase
VESLPAVPDTEDVAELRARLATLQAEIAAIHAESPLGLFVRRALNRMPIAGSLPIFGGGLERAVRERLSEPFAKAVRAVSRSAFPARPGARSPVRLPRITMVTPVYNGAAYIGEAIRSVLGQNYPSLQYIIADGGSTDGTQAIAAAFGDAVEVFSHPDRGMYDALHGGFARAHGEVFGYLNADDVLEPGALERVGRFFAEHPRVDVIYHEDIVDYGGWRFPNVAQPPGIGPERLLRGHILFQDGVFFRARAYDAAGGVNPSLRLAGDSLLWVALARKFRFVRRPGHVSTFRVRPGQLSAQMDRYVAERERAFAALRRTMWPTEKIWNKSRALVRKVVNRIAWRHEIDRLFFPVDFSQVPPPAAIAPPPPFVDPPVCPITGALADRLLFTSPDTRFGDERLNYISYVPESHLAIAYPRYEEAELTDLYERHYSNPERVVKLPAGHSPYRHYRAKGLLPNFALRRRFPQRWIPPGDAAWADRTYEEMLEVLEASGAHPQDTTAFLDVGCFEGKLLDRVRRETSWTLAGIEPNPSACAQARAKGHDVYLAGVERAASAVPLDERFDVLWLGQAIEHFNDPLAALLSLNSLLVPGGRLVLSTPNLDSAQIDMFGPTWSNWHPPYHRHIFSVKALSMLAERANMRLVVARTYSHPYWTFMNLLLHEHGLAAAIPHDIPAQGANAERALSIAGWSKLLFDPYGRGDYIVAALEKKS